MRCALFVLALIAIPLAAGARARQHEEPPPVVEEGSRVRVTLLARKNQFHHEQWKKVPNE